MTAPEALPSRGSSFAKADGLDLSLVFEDVEVTLDDTKDALGLCAGNELRPCYGPVIADIMSTGITA